MIKLKDLLFEGPFDKLNDMERYVERSLPSTLKRNGSVDSDNSSMIVSYRGRIAPDVTSGSEYQELKDDVKKHIKKLKGSIDKYGGKSIEFSYFDEWVGFDIRMKPMDYKSPEMIEELFGKPPKSGVAWVKHNYYSAILYFDKDDRKASSYAKQVERTIRKENLDEQYMVDDEWKEFSTSRENKKDIAKKKGTLIEF